MSLYETALALDDAVPTVQRTEIGKTSPLSAGRVLRGSLTADKGSRRRFGQRLA